MPNTICVSRVVEVIRNFVESFRCPICDKSDGIRRRFPCGHIVCDDCNKVTGGCLLCLTPPNTTQLQKTRFDSVLTKRTQNACELLNACQTVFDVDVYKSVRISQLQKIEKDVFPQCIQAPVKYCNKRKSFPSKIDKENIYTFPGEIVSPNKNIKMKKSLNVIQHWLKSNESYTRRALSDLNVNRQSNSNNMNSRKRKHVLSPGATNIKQTKLNSTNVKRNKPEIKVKSSQKCEHEESGIVLDDEPIIIEDSQSQNIDKDKLALLAVHVADNCVSDNNISFDKFSKENTKVSLEPERNKKYIKVPFYKKGTLATCLNCNQHMVTGVNNGSDISKDISISIQNKNIVANINITSSSIVSNPLKNSISIQTDISDLDLSSISYDSMLDKSNVSAECAFHVNKDIINAQQFSVQSKGGIQEKTYGNSKKNIIISDSDSDTTSDASILQISADIHRSCVEEDYGVLQELSSENLIYKSKTKSRGNTPDSSNSSDKENFDPNKRRKCKNKKYKK